MAGLEALKSPIGPFFGILTYLFALIGQRKELFSKYPHFDPWFAHRWHGQAYFCLQFFTLQPYNTACTERERVRWHVSLVFQAHVTIAAPDRDLWRTLCRLSYSAAAAFKNLILLVTSLAISWVWSVQRIGSDGASAVQVEFSGGRKQMAETPRYCPQLMTQSS